MGYLTLPLPSDPIPRTESELRYFSKAKIKKLDQDLRTAYAVDAARLCSICDTPLGYGVQLAPSTTKIGDLDHLTCTWMRDARAKKRWKRAELFE